MASIRARAPFLVEAGGGGEFFFFFWEGGGGGGGVGGGALFFGGYIRGITGIRNTGTISKDHVTTLSVEPGGGGGGALVL